MNELRFISAYTGTGTLLVKCSGMDQEYILIKTSNHEKNIFNSVNKCQLHKFFGAKLIWNNYLPATKCDSFERESDECR
jgi:hypothetical protein